MAFIKRRSEDVVVDVNLLLLLSVPFPKSPMDISVAIRDDDDDDVPTDSRTFSEIREHEGFLNNATLRCRFFWGTLRPPEMAGD